MITAGLTGGICCGKSTISKTFVKHNIPVIDADLITRQLVVPGSLGLNSIIHYFGTDILLSDANLDRAKLGELVFNNAHQLDKLNKIMQPLIEEETNNQLFLLRNAGHKITIFDAALILETGHADRYRPLIVASCPREEQIVRLMKRNGLTRSQALVRIGAQMPTEQKEKMADYIINTSNSIESSIQQTEVIIEKLKLL